MTEAVIADFVGRFQTDVNAREEPTTGRILLSKRRLVLVSDTGKKTIPVSTMFDISVGMVPPEVAEFFSDTVTVAYVDGRERRLAVVEGKNGNVDRFVTVLFKVILGGTRLAVRHPARVGGRVTDAETQRGRLRLEPHALVCVDCPTPFRIDLSTVSEIERTRRVIGEHSRDVLEVDHMRDETVLTTLLTVPSRRVMNILGRYVRLEYSSFLDDVRELEHTSEELEALVALYSTGGSTNLGTLLSADPAQVTMILNSLESDDLVEDRGGVTKLTPRGRIVVSKHLEAVNA